MNIKKYYLYNVFNDLMPIYPLYLLMFESRGLSVFQISLLLITWSVPVVILEIPTGILADRWNRKNMIALGELLKALCFLIWFFADGFIGYAIGFVLWGTGGAFQSGAEEALLYDTLKLQGIEERFDQILGKGHFISGMSNIIASITGGLIGSRFGYKTALVLSIIAGLVTVIIVYGMEEVNSYKEYIQRQKIKTQKIKVQAKTLKSAFSFLFGCKEVFLITLLAVFAVTTADELDEYDQLIAKEYGLSVELIGVWAAIRFVMMSFGSYFARGIRIFLEKLMPVKKGIYTIGSLCMMAAILLIISGTVKRIGIMSLYGMYYFIMAAGEVIQEDYIQQRVETEGRATIHSLVSLSKNISGILYFGLFGFVVSNASLHAGLVITGIYITVWVVFAIGFYRLSIRKSNYTL